MDNSANGRHATTLLQENVVTMMLNLRGKIFSCLFAVSLGIQLYLVKVVQNSVQPYSVMLLRSFAFLLAIPFINYEDSKKYQLNDMFLYFLYGVLNYACRIAAYIALIFAQLGNVSAITSNMAMPSAFLGLLILGEPITRFHVVVFIINAVGIVLVSKPPLIFDYQSNIKSTEEYYGAVLAVLAVIARSLASVVSRGLSNQSKSDAALCSVFTGICGILVTSLLVTTFTGLTLPESFQDQLAVLGVCVSSLSGNVFLVLALQYEPVVVVSVFMSLSLTVAYFLQITFLAVIPGFFEVLGIVLILGTNFAFLLKSPDD